MDPTQLDTRLAPGLIRGTDGVARCFWAGQNADYIEYHDREWGVPVADDRRLFEKICLEGFQSGLSWLTILRKRQNFRDAFSGFDVERVATYTERDVERLLQDRGIIRHRGKIEAAINNARRACEMASRHGSLAAFFWQWEPAASSRPARIDHPTLLTLTKSAESIAMARELKRQGWRFVGPTTAYAFMQAMGLVNDHIEGCCFRAEAERRRLHFRRPSQTADR